MKESKEILQEDLINSILTNGPLDEKTIELSQKLDIYMVIEQRAITYGN